MLSHYILKHASNQDMQDYFKLNLEDPSHPTLIMGASAVCAIASHRRNDEHLDVYHFM